MNATHAYLYAASAAFQPRKRPQSVSVTDFQNTSSTNLFLLSVVSSGRTDSIGSVVGLRCQCKLQRKLAELNKATQDHWIRILRRRRIMMYSILSVLLLMAAAGSDAATFETLQVSELLGHARAPVAVHEAPRVVNTSSFLMQIMHRDTLHNATATATATLTYEQRLRRRLARDATRLRQLGRVADAEAMHQTEAVQFGSDVDSGLAMGSGEYVVSVGVGTPPRSQYMVVDTGSDISWLQCRPCRQCYPQSGQIFDPATSTSFSVVACASPVCRELSSGRCGGGGTCVYKVEYADGSRTAGIFATERLRFGSTTVQNVALGCGQDNSGLFVGAGGLLGLGAGQLSFPNQLGGQTAGVFSYCLADREGAAGGSLIFGPVPVSGAVTAPLLRNPALPSSLYLVSLAGMMVGSELVLLPEYHSSGGAIVDSGTAVTRLPTSAYVTFRNVFLAYTAGLPRAAGVAIFDTCYNLAGLESVRVPTVGFYFSKDAMLMLPPRNYMVAVDLLGTFCLALAPTASGPSIIGNLQQQHIQISFDSANSVISFAPNQC